MRRLAVMCIALGAAGCAGGLHSSAPGPQAYVLRAPAPAAHESRDPLPSVRILRPDTSPGLNTDHIMLLQSDRRLSYYAASRWAGPLADMVEALTVETLRGTGDWSAVEDSRSSFNAEYYLQITIRRFEADYAEQPGAAPVVHVSLTCELGRRIDRELIASFAVEGAERAAENRLSAVVAAFERASATALTSAAERAAAAVRSSQSHSPPSGGKPSS
jgi:cholesterol transport system auxiliary component